MSYANLFTGECSSEFRLSLWNWRWCRPIVQFIYECNVMNDCNNIQVNVCISLLFLYLFLNWIRHTYNIDCRLAYWKIHLFTCRLVIFACPDPLSLRWAVRRAQTEIFLKGEGETTLLYIIIFVFCFLYLLSKSPGERNITELGLFLYLRRLNLLTHTYLR